MSEPTKRRPWWAVAIAGGFGVGLGLMPGLLRAERAHEPVVVDSDKLDRIESKLDDALQRIARIEGRLERR